MDTKWKNLINKLNIPAVRKLIPLILFISIAANIFAFGGIIKFRLTLDNLGEKDVFDSSEFYWETEAIENLLIELSELKSKDYINSGGTLANYNLDSYAENRALDAIYDAGCWYDSDANKFYSRDTGQEVTQIMNVKTANYGTVGVILKNSGFFSTPAQNFKNYNASESQEIVTENASPAVDSESAVETTVESSSSESETEYYNFLTENNIYFLDEFYDLFYGDAIDYYIQYDIQRYNEVTNQLSAYGKVSYFVSNGTYTSMNCFYGADDFHNLPFFYIIDGRGVRTNADAIKNRLLPYELDSGTSIMYGFETSEYNSIYSNWQFTKTLTLLYFTLLILSFIAALGALVYILFFVGMPVTETAENSNGPRPGSHKLGKSRIYSDISAGAIFFGFMLSTVIIADSIGRGRYRPYYYYYAYENVTIKNYFTGSYLFWGIIISLFAGAIITYLVYGLIWDYKRKQLIRHSLLYRVYSILGNLISNISNKIPVGYRLVSARKIRKIKIGISRIQEGDYSQPIKIRGHGHMAQIAEGINEISVGFNIAVENRIKSERMKTELISNVSHDIRTPLTSIITYVDLLKKEGNTPEETARYLEVLESKTARLKILIDDLFEASKVSSGNIATELMPTDLINVLDQAMGELEDKIEASGLTFKLGLPSEKLMAMADGKILWRIINNLFSNIFKYSMAGSRVYIDVFEDNNENAVITFKNMSAYELNISSDELMERFTRGDKSRSSEGSGLGLNIARSLTELMGGQFDINLDGDLFKVIITLKKA